MTWTGDATALEDDLRRSVRGEVRFDDGSRAVYSTDASNYRQVPIGAVAPLDAEDLAAAVAACRRQRAPIVHRGAGTSLAGQSCNVAVVIDSSRHFKGVLAIDPERRTARVLPGTVLDDLRSAALRHGLTFGPDPATHAWCTVGGMIGNNSCGVHSLTTGRTSDNVEELEILTYDGLRLQVGATPEREIDRIVRAGGRRGEIYRRLRELRDRYAGVIRERYPKIPRRVSGYNLDDLLPERGFHVARALAGTEGTCVSFLEATVRLAPAPKFRVLLVLGYPDVVQAAEAVPELLVARPYGLEGMDRFLVDNELTRRSYRETLSRLPPGDAWLLVEFGGETLEEAVERAQSIAGSNGLLMAAPGEQARIWQVREAAVATTSRDPRLGDGWPGWEDSAVAPERFAGYLRGLLALLDRHRYRAAFYGHFGEGCLHARIDFDFSTPAAIRTYRTFMEEAADLVVAHGGSLSGEHGDGQQRGELLPRMFGEELVQAFREFKAIWDPGNRMNPGKKVDPYPLDADLRPALRLADPPATFRYANDAGSFARAVTRCVGVGKCRRDETHTGIMCPSYLATRDETHSTRGRARLLFEMLEGEVVRDGWRSTEVRAALDLCLACKGCRTECPAGVDMATYKAEFLHHHFAGRPRPRSAYAMGLIPWWARLASRAPGLANGMTQGPLSGILKKLGGIHPDRTLPAFARKTFRESFVADRGGQPTVLLWPDTFNNFFHPEIARAAVEVLEAAGHRVAIPAKTLCCGRPLYDFGMLDLARRQLRRILSALKGEIAAGLPMVGLEPSCVAVFRDELVNLFPEDEAARRLSAQTFTFAEFLVREGFSPPRTSGAAIVHGHCHHHSVMGMGADRTLLAAMGLDFQILDSGCCGMAGAFGFEAEHYEVSRTVGERALLPAVRAAAPDALILADGFSCREQIAQLSGRGARHLAEVVAAAFRS